MLYEGRTDLASESLRQLGGGLADLSREKGVKAGTELLYGLKLSAVHILDEMGEIAIGKPRGRYYTLELPSHFHRGGDAFPSAVKAIADLIGRCCKKPSSVLVACLGNPDISPDALGPLAAGWILVTRHLKQMGERSFEDLCSVAVCRPGVLGSSGIESSQQVALLVKDLKPDLLLCIDALAGADDDMLCRCIQISDKGIRPGSGVGNDRKELSRDSLGLDVVSIGMPTVLDASLLGARGRPGLFVTSRDIDLCVRSAARLIGYGIDLALSPELSIEDLDMLLG